MLNNNVSGCLGIHGGDSRIEGLAMLTNNLITVIGDPKFGVLNISKFVGNI